jgi:transposase
MKHLADALDQVRRSEYKRVHEKERRLIKGQRYTLLSHQANLDTEGRKSLQMLLKANQRLHKASLLKESFGQFWDYNQFADLIDKHWKGVISDCHLDHKVSLGFMEGLNNKIRVIQRRAYGIKDQEYLMLKVVTSFIKEQK